jgi:alkane 1-monooxygenase
VIKNDFKYLLAYIIPVSGYFAIYYNGWLSFLTVIIAFVLIPIFEFVLSPDNTNLSQKAYEDLKNRQFFDLLLYINIPLLYGLITYFGYSVATQDFATSDIVGKVLSVGIVGGTSGINVAHELGHKSGKSPQLGARLLLLPLLYLHFIIEHNRGHHLLVSTPEDPATSRKGEAVYFFWFRSILFSYLSAWNLENKRLRKSGHSFWSFDNEMIRFSFLHLSYLLLVFIAGGILSGILMIAVALVAILLLESINYIEHYGILRKKEPSGRYEKVLPIHSWNSDHTLGRIILYELVRHSDHHYKANKKYQTLKSINHSPQLPLGYPTSILAALIPPLWFSIMDHRIPTTNN